MTWHEVLRAKPVEAILAFGGLTAITLIAAFALRRGLRRATSLRHVVLAVALSALGLGVLAALAAARLMLLDSAQAWTFVSVLTMAAGFAALLAVVVARPLGDDVRRLEHMVRRVEAGDRDVRTGVHRGDELGHVARALDDLVGRLDVLERERQAIDGERRSLLSSVGHDLRTPLTALRAAVEALADGVAPDPQRYLRAMEADLAALGTMVDDVFLLARLEAGTLHLDAQPFDLADITEDAVVALSPVANTRHVHVRVVQRTPSHVRGDASALARVVRNLLDNALRHSPEHGTIVVSLDSGAEGHVELRVTDDGPGFPEDFREAAFRPASRADVSRTRATGGSGLGLAIARGIVEAHGGRIWIEPARPGAEVAVALPALPVLPAQPAQPVLR